MRVYEKCSNLKRQKTNLQHKQTSSLAYPTWVKNKFQANSHHSPASLSLKQKERSVCQHTTIGEFVMVEDCAFYHSIGYLGTNKINQNQNREKRYYGIVSSLISSSSFVCCTCKEHHACHGRALPHISKNPGAIWQIHPRSHHPDQLFPFTVATKHTPDKPNHPSSIHRDAEDMNIEHCYIWSSYL